MAHYRWELVTGPGTWDGTDSNGYLSIRGDKDSMREVQISDPNETNNFERGSTNHGIIDTADLGNLLTGTLRHDGWGLGSDWTVQSIRVTSDDDGRSWLAKVNKELTKNEIFRLEFKLVDAGQYEQMQGAARDALDKKRREDEARAQKIQDEEEAAGADEAEKKAKRELDAERRNLDLELKKAKQQADLLKVRAEIEKLKGGADPSGAGSGSGGGGVVRTIELFAVMGGRAVPLIAGLVNSAGRYSVASGARVMTGDGPGEGFGYGGSPGRWSEASGGQPPTSYGQDPTVGIVASDGSRAWPMPSATLEQIFGSNWRAVIT